MKGTRRSKVWLALGLVAMACLVLAGCPHNNLLDSSGGGGAGNGGGGRGGSDGVRLVITNFVSEEGAANRSASWLGGPQRTIAPEHIDLTDQTTLEKYVFVANGTSTSGDTFGPKFIDIAQGTGEVNLDISGSDAWTITVEGYAVDKLTGPLGAADRNGILQKQPNEVTAQKADALVLQGGAILDLGAGGNRVTLTLTNDGVGTNGDVNLDIYFDTDADKTKIEDNTYDVTVALYDLVTGEMVATTENKIITGTRPADPENYNVTDVPKGNYQFRLTVTDPADSDKAVAYYVDEIVVEGNRAASTTSQHQDGVHIANLFNDPSKPTGFEVYWSKPQAGELKEGYLAYFQWSGLSYNAVGVDIEIADITNWYKYDAAKDKVAFNGDQELNAQTDIWTQIDGLPGAGAVQKEAVVTNLSWNSFYQDAQEYPAIYRDGSQLTGSSGVVFLMESGHVYSARIRAVGAQAPSDWVVVGTAGTVVQPQNLAGVAGGVNATKFERPATVGLFDLYTVTYDLQDQFLLFKTTDGVSIGTKATTDDLLSYHEYKPGTPYQVVMKYGNMTAPVTNDWFLYPQLTSNGQAPTQLNDRRQGWTGWENSHDASQKFTVGNNWGAPGYSGHKNLRLTQVGGGSGGVQVKAETSGTFNVLDDTNVLVAIEADETKTVQDAGWQELTNGDTNGGVGTDVKTTGLGLGKDNTRYILNLNRGATTKTFLYVAVGDDATADKVGILTDENNSEFIVGDIQVEVKKGLTNVKSFTQVASSAAAAWANMDGMASGDYTLHVKIRTSTGYYQTYQVPLAVKYDDQVIQ